LAGIAAAAPLLATAAWVVGEGPLPGESAAQETLAVIYWTVGLATGAVALYSAARLVRVLDELEATRTELAGLASGRGRLRISRDLHDLLGHSLSAISLKGDLARRLLPSNVHAARAEIEGLTEVARDALRGVHAVTRDKHALSLRTETDGAAALLGAAGIDARIEGDLPGLPRPTEDVLAWGVREGVSNGPRASQATTCSVTAARRDAMVRLEIVNDGARPSAGGGNGLAGLAARAGALSGSAAGERTNGGRFRLLVEIPGEDA